MSTNLRKRYVYGLFKFNKKSRCENLFSQRDFLSISRKNKLAFSQPGMQRLQILLNRQDGYVYRFQQAHIK
jgi:hypothetical protein